MTRHFHVKPHPVGWDNLDRHIASNGRAFPSPWPRRLFIIAMIVGAVVGLVSGVVV